MASETPKAGQSAGKRLLDSESAAQASTAHKGSFQRRSQLAAGSAAQSSQSANAASAAPVLARFIKFTGQVISADSRPAAAQRIVAQLRQVVSVDRAVLTTCGRRNEILAVDTGADVVRQARFANTVASLAKSSDQPEPAVLYAADGSNEADPRATDQREAMGGTNLLWVPVRTPGQSRPGYGLWLERWHGKAWQTDEVRLAERLSPYLAAALDLPRRKKRGWGWLIALVLLLLMLIPVQESAVAPARVVADQPRHVFAPLDGILEQVLVKPGQWVRSGEPLFTYDEALLQQQLEEGRREVAVARAELARLEGAAYADQAARAGLPAQKLAVEQAESRLAWYAEQQSRSRITAPVDGLVVMPEIDRFIGVPVQLGEALCQIADPGKTRLTLHVPVADAALLEEGGEIAVRLDRDPFNTRAATVRRIGYEIELSPDDIPSVVVEADWLEAQDTVVRPGQQAAARIYGQRTLLGWQLFRKPLQSVAAALGI